jgi:hypothetical protein
VALGGPCCGFVQAQARVWSILTLTRLWLTLPQQQTKSFLRHSDARAVAQRVPSCTTEVGFWGATGLCPISRAGVAGGISLDTLANYGAMGGSGGDAAGGGRAAYGGSSAYGAGGGNGNGGSSAYGVPESTYGAGGYGVTRQPSYGSGAAATATSAGVAGGYNASYGHYQQQPQQQQQQQQASLIDAVPHAQPAYPYYQQQVCVAVAVEHKMDARQQF